MHALVRELLALMPADGAPWPRADRERWAAALTAALDVVYDDDGRPREPYGVEGRDVVDLRDEALAPGTGRHARRPD